MRLRIDLSYDGRDFRGWATQPGLRTVQDTLEQALATALRQSSVAVTCAGRTDTGVHARGQVVHTDVRDEDLAAAAGRSTAPPTESLARRLNGILPPDVRVRRVAEAPPGFDARFGARWRRYAYRICDGVPDPLARGSVLWWPRPLDAAAMDDAASRLVGEHDFAAFCKKREGATTVRTLLDYSWTRTDDGLLEATVRADAFCHSMVRSLVGCAIAVGEGRHSPDWAATILTAGARDPAVVVVPAHGLALEEVAYPPDEELAAQAERARAIRTLPTIEEDR